MARLIGVGLLAVSIAILAGCSKTMIHQPNPANIQEDPFALLERLIQSEGLRAPAFFEINADFFKAVTAIGYVQTSTVYFDDIGRTELICKGDKYCSVFVYKTSGENAYRYITKSEITARKFIDTLFAAKQASAALKQQPPIQPQPQPAQPQPPQPQPQPPQPQPQPQPPPQPPPPQ